MEQELTRTIGIVVVAAGRGERAGASVEGPKQYRRIGGRPVLWHTLRHLLDWPRTGPIVVVIHPDDQSLFDAVRAQLPADAPVFCVSGGATRQISVRKGLKALEPHGISHVLIHDGVRPFLDRMLLDRIDAGLSHGSPALLPALPISDTVKRGVDGLVTDTISRTGLYAAQTPQAFQFSDILDAHNRAAEADHVDFTDDASIAEWAGLKVTLVEGSADNVKLTVQKDIAMADQKLTAAPLPDVRTGNGYDVHQLEPGDGVTLCGIFLPHDQRLKGHSDADVALHALTDALLATCGAGDIGDHFPPSDPQWRGAASRIFVEHAVRIVRDAGGTIMNADISLIAEAPKIGPRRQEMRENLSDMLGISLDRCSVKATTNETIGFVGRREGIAAIATATVVFQGRSA
ncbi:bifunctional 2-C-methyl-D-erythritol 4-phosphate cytidylyltransferase/2-C-methyl-D-erythritol 2,4-cyclodiphosphate synthase [Rhizobium sp. CECT 9324]|jgi:2-C-methyl-D-erythritol 4-phosphate cytidylyltransferase/2-C-methyl-D-erythritol 2,4-cyclodiphosphate synthase|uniref:bifunctional 2-C-methyl-D-erythritol 4-phosphate cytidylyltransferase/2-C-methyl-D-erythritol 2,4-cyclodiphosphate synthase n=1 Tax=Rhizobium sp. CECT 9324 TaxID=2845820 RepID=UPI001E43866F|nr:bifunctional 2-C-methyl-D-erythritol 4-phosphate cytidylyltransferase/2-C-methyl-D-erythritol 2,4-cyclodiphosphate synthase [Rhizobium sp. CECT 9324]CAH0340692.1 Bifunctional enzyme IspD/IspF [Rhizobium sp. CECT 9324]